MITFGKLGYAASKLALELDKLEDIYTYEGVYILGLNDQLIYEQINEFESLAKKYKLPIFLSAELNDLSCFLVSINCFHLNHRPEFENDAEPAYFFSLSFDKVEYKEDIFFYSIIDELFYEVITSF